MMIAEIKNLPPQEKIVLINEIWQTLEDDDFMSPEWHNDVLDARKQQVANNTAEFIDISQLK
jgi:hypothetical protein